MQESSFYRFCISACIFLILISLCMNFVIILGVFNTHTPSPILNQTTHNITEQQSSFGNNIVDNLIGMLMAEGVVAGALGIGVVLYATKTGSWNIVAAYLFGAVFWISWSSNLSFMTTIGNYFTSAAMIALMAIVTVMMTFIFIGAIIGLLGGTE